MYSVVGSVLVRPLPYPNPEQVVTVYNTFPDWRGHEMWGSVVGFMDAGDHTRRDHLVLRNRRGLRWPGVPKKETEET